MKRFDPLNLFGAGFSDEYCLGFYARMLHLSEHFCLIPASTVGGLAVRLTTHPDFPLTFHSIPRVTS